jgi:hypothetical protein
MTCICMQVGEGFALLPLFLQSRNEIGYGYTSLYVYSDY